MQPPAAPSPNAGSIPPVPPPAASDAHSAPQGFMPPVPQAPAPFVPAMTPTIAPTGTPAAVNPTTNSGTPAVAEDGDLIEKEWVQKVEQIIAATANDPFQQSQQFAALKADYLQKRYSKSLKTSG